MDNLNNIRVFVRVAESRSFSEAGKRLGLTSSAVSKAITRLERELGVRLLQRTTRSVGLTNDGASFFENCRQILSDVQSAEENLLQTRATPYGLLRVHMPVAFGRKVVMPVIKQLIDRHPRLTINAELSDRNIDMAYEGIDVAVHIGEITDSRLVARKLCNLQFVAVASPDYLERHGEPMTPDDLSSHHCLAYVKLRSGRYREWTFAHEGETVNKVVSGRLNVNNAESLLEAAVSGLGIAMISTLIAGDAIRKGQLRCVLTQFNAPGPSVYALYPHTRTVSPKVRVFVDFLKELMAEQQQWNSLAEPADSIVNPLQQ